MKKFNYSGKKRNYSTEKQNKEKATLEHEMKKIKKKDEQEIKILKSLLEFYKKTTKMRRKINDELKEIEQSYQKLIESNQHLIDISLRQAKEIKDLENEMKEFSPIVFGYKICKLLKKLLEYIVNDSDLSPGLIKIDNEIYFLRVPKKCFSLNYNISDIIGALNKILRIIFFNTSDCDYKMHYVHREARLNKNLRERIPVFNHYKEFFKFFRINELYENILITLIPRYLFTTIDNYSFEEGNDSLLSKIK